MSSDNYFHSPKSGAYNRTSRPAAQPPKFYLAQPVPAAGVEEGAGVEEVYPGRRGRWAGVEEVFYPDNLFYNGGRGRWAGLE